MIRINIYTFLILCIAFISGRAQDIHFSQFYFSPLTMNPAHTGFFTGKYRVASNFRNQWKNATGGYPYITYTASYDAHIAEFMMQNSDIMGFGVIAFGDKAGTAGMGTTGGLLSYAFHKDIFGKGKNFASLGIQAGATQIGFDRSKIRFGDEILSESPAGSGQEAFDKSNLIYLDVNAGAMWNSIISEKISVYAGFAAFHLNYPRINFIASSAVNHLSPRLVLNGGAIVNVAKGWDILPLALFMWQDASNQTNLGMAARYNTPAEALIRAGVWYRQWRNTDALIIMTAIEFKNLTVGGSYDINVSSLKKASYGQGSFEIALIYIIKKGTTRAIPCPHF